MADHDIRWLQRFSNFNKAFTRLKDAVLLAKSRELSDLEEQGLIQAFEFTHELTWKVLKDYFEYQGNPSINGARDATREAFQIGLIKNGDAWMEMIKSRNMTSHTYDEETAEEISDKIINEYFPLFEGFQTKMTGLGSQNNPPS